MPQNAKQAAQIQKLRVEDIEWRQQVSRDTGASDLVIKTTLVLNGTPHDGSIVTRAFLEFVPRCDVYAPKFEPAPKGKPGGTIRFSADLASLPAMKPLLAQDALFVTYSEEPDGGRNVVLSGAEYT